MPGVLCKRSSTEKSGASRGEKGGGCWWEENFGDSEKLLNLERTNEKSSPEKKLKNEAHRDAEPELLYPLNVLQIGGWSVPPKKSNWPCASR